MATSKIAKIVRGVVGYNAEVFNDKLKNGMRSIKVNCGNDEAQVDAIKSALEAAGYQVKKVKTLTRYEALRLHVA